jgi:hypothetical protein
MVRYFIVSVFIGLTIIVMQPLSPVDPWTLFIWSLIVFTACDFLWWATPHVWRWLSRSKPTVGDDWQRIMAADAAPLQLNPDLMLPGNVVMARDLGLPDDATFGEMNAEIRRRSPAPKPAGRYAVRGANGKFVKRPKQLA